MTSLTLDRLKQVTGVFITESAFQVIELEYKNYLKDNQYPDNEDVADQFIEEWKEEQEVLGTFGETTDGNIKFYCMDGAEDIKVTTSEFLDNLDMTSYHWENMCRRDWNVFREILETGKVNKELLSNILKEETISHEQIYQLLDTMKVRVTELINKTAPNCAACLTNGEHI